MVCSFYIVTIKDRKEKELLSAKVYSFQEAYWLISKARDEFPNAVYFTINYPLAEYDKEMERKS